MTTCPTLADEISDSLTFREVDGGVEAMQSEVFIYPGMLDLDQIPLRVTFSFFHSERARGRVEAQLVGFDGTRATYSIDLRI